MQLQEHVSLQEHTTLRLGGAARFFVSVTSIEELRVALEYAHTEKLPVFILGGGSNTLFSDDGWNGIVIHMALMGKEYEEDSRGDARVIAYAGEPWDVLVAETVGQGLWGMENLSAIPGTVGAAPIQNIGAYGVEVSSIIDWVEALDMRTGELHILSPTECAFAYRDSFFKHAEGQHYVVVRVAFRLSTHPAPHLEYRDLREYFGEKTDVSVADVRDAIVAIRRAKFPNLDEVGTAGSFFKNPVIPAQLLVEMRKWLGDVPHFDAAEQGFVKVPLAWLLERLGWKGKRNGHVGCWDKQPLVLVHYGGGTASELVLFAHEIMNDVKRRVDIRLEPEVHVVKNK